MESGKEEDGQREQQADDLDREGHDSSEKGRKEGKLDQQIK